MTEKTLYKATIISLVSNVILLYLFAAMSIVALGRREVTNCVSFLYQQNAQRAYVENPQKYKDLDKDRDGRACEFLPQ